MAVRLVDLAPAAQDLLERSVAWMDRYWDTERGLLWDMGEVADPDGSAHCPSHIVRESAWYALGLLMRDRTGDADRAVQALEAILPHQFDEPGKVYHGTFYRAPEESHPPEPAIEWKHYDPNWREFIITAIAVILSEYEESLPRPLIDKIDAAIRKAVEGALARHLTARYTNIALMDAQMLVYAGDRLGEHPWIEAGEAMGREVHRLFKLHDAFEEYNSPTYYGTDVYALGLWQAYCPSPQLQQMGAEMEEVLWRDIARFYHAGLRNVAGPYDRVLRDGHALLCGPSRRVDLAGHRAGERAVSRCERQFGTRGRFLLWPVGCRARVAGACGRHPAFHSLSGRALRRAHHWRFPPPNCHSMAGRVGHDRRGIHFLAKYWPKSISSCDDPLACGPRAKRLGTADGHAAGECRRQPSSAGGHQFRATGFSDSLPRSSWNWGASE